MATKSRIELPRSQGQHTRQAHTDLPADSYEREIGRDGFFGAASHMYHRHPPTAWLRMEGPLRPRAFDTVLLDAISPSPWFATPLLHNNDVRIHFWATDLCMTELARNADGDTLLFIHRGSGHLYCDYGHLGFRDGDYIILPRGTMWRIEPDDLCQILLIEAHDDVFSLPHKGLLGTHAIFDPAMLETPLIDESFLAQQTEDEWQVVVKRNNQLTTIIYPFNPLDAIGWKGSLLPVKINWRDMRPVMSHRYHIPPSVHTTFVATNFVICTFCPRPIESDPGALKVPFFHSNEDYDEVIFYHRGDFFSRDNIHPGMLTLHPAGITHGPHPKAYETGQQAARKETDEVAVMIDSRAPLTIDNAARDLERTDYVNAWRSPQRDTV